ncbi:hypothetical protein G5V59_17655 [Nocardioides sp. W3-2-3]|uniref:DUF6670 family protein n=1 Tax=Nocardioides convexus TaxID=2712224 RepID=UPI0024188F26|nr:DUF6670 family protein [Nocardioides convexus]NHA01089.1 hypothetical protein [Nocardioides convexus]
MAFPLLGPAYDAATALTLRTALRVNRAARRSGTPFDDEDGLVPHTQRRGASWSHNGLMLPDLPEPLRFLSVTTVVGGAGVRISDLATPSPGDGPRDRAILGVATAVSGFAGDHALSRDCESAPDGSRWRFGADLLLTGTYPSFRVHAAGDGLSVDLAVTASRVVTWFVDLPGYRHLSLLARYRGTIEHAGTPYDVAGLGCYEYACAPGLHLLTGRTVPRGLRLSMDFFTYQVLDIGEGAQPAPRRDRGGRPPGPAQRLPARRDRALGRAGPRRELRGARPPPGARPHARRRAHDAAAAPVPLAHASGLGRRCRPRGGHRHPVPVGPRGRLRRRVPVQRAGRRAVRRGHERLRRVDRPPLSAEPVSARAARAARPARRCGRRGSRGPRRRSATTYPPRGPRRPPTSRR